ncbi:MAG: 23S rRNA (adenine(2030)-N(6))-methyltransferase RlmJ [Proteobacteria bacterium]|nr:MAG: 23S rRNA (adenine(2030)-N(6))-methyltransferase RlmJ [Pseudomonadota bacterium]
MLSYRHAFHAGNHADVLKHATLSQLLKRLCQKDKPFTYLDTHAGGGLYHLQSAWSQKTNEAEQGIIRLWKEPSAWPELNTYVQTIQRYNPNSSLAYYPGSPAIASQLSRAQDKLILCELHPNEFQALRQHLGQDKRVALHQRDGFEALPALLPPHPRRGLVLIDPPYERREDYVLVSTALKRALQRWNNGIYMVWYPLLAKNRDASQSLLQSLQTLSCKNLLRIELSVASQPMELGMYGSGVAIINAPWQLDTQIKTWLARLCTALQVDQYAQWRLEWLINDH